MKRHFISNLYLNNRHKEPSDEEPGAFNLSERQRPVENRRQWVLQEEVGRVQDGVPVPANGGGWTQ